MDAVIATLKRLSETPPSPLRLPDEKEIEAVENALGVEFHPDYKKYLIEASDVSYGTLEPATIPADSGHTYIVPLAKTAWEMGVPTNLIPIAEDNGDYYCMDQEGQVLYWSHNGTVDEKWQNLEAWMREVWLEGN